MQDGRTALLAAANGRHVDVMQVLLAKGKPSVAVPDKYVRAPSI